MGDKLYPLNPACHLDAPAVCFPLSFKSADSGILLVVTSPDPSQQRKPSLGQFSPADLSVILVNMASAVGRKIARGYVGSAAKAYEPAE